MQSTEEKTAREIDSETKQLLVHKNLSSYEIHEISRLYHHLKKITRNNGANITSEQYDTARITLIRLEQRVANIGSLSIRPESDIELHRFYLEPFSVLECLSLNRCPPSTILDLYSFRNQLKKLEVLNAGIPQLSKLLAPIKPKYLKYSPLLLVGNQRTPKLGHVWSKLSVLTLFNCGLTRLDSSLHMVPNLVQLDVSHNDIQHIIHLYHCHSLTTINISYNRVRVLSNINLVLPHIRRLNLSHNSIESLDGLDKLYSLERIDLSYNKINDFSEFYVLVKLKNFTHLYSSGNPISLKNNYRLHILTQFLHESSLHGRQLPTLDGIVLSAEELSTLQSSIFLPPETVVAENLKSSSSLSPLSSNHSSALLIGGTLMRLDDVPIHELDKIFSTESGKFNSDSQILGLVTGASSVLKSTVAMTTATIGNTTLSGTSTTLSREKILNYCQRRLIKRKREYNIRKIQDPADNGNGDGGGGLRTGDKEGESESEQLLGSIDLTRLMRASSAGSTRHSNETLIFSDAGIHLLEFEDFENTEQRLSSLSAKEPSTQITPKSPPVSRSSTSGDLVIPTRSDSLTSSNELNDNKSQSAGSIQSTNSSVRNREAIESKSSDSGERASRKSNDSNFVSFSSRLSDEIPDLSTLMQQMSRVTQNAPHPHPLPLPHSQTQSQSQLKLNDEGFVNSTDNSLQFNSYNSSTSKHDSTHLKILMDVVNSDDTPENSPCSVGEKAEESPQRIGRAENEITSSTLEVLDESADQTSPVGKRTRKGRWGTTRPPLAADLKSSSSKSHQFSIQSQRSNSPPGSVISDNWESKHTKSNYETQTDASSVYSGEEPGFYPRNAPTTAQISNMFTRAAQEEAIRFATLTNQHFPSTPIQSYTGSLEYEYLSVTDNLEKYFFEQVFGAARPSREAPYMRHEYTQDQNNRYCRNFSQLHDMNPLEVLYVDIPYQPEKLVAVYRVKVLDISHLNQKAVNSDDGREDSINIPVPLIFALTDINLYILLDNFANNAIFADAPLPILRKIHPIDSLRSCIIYFGYQRCVFQFRDDDINPLHKKKYLTVGQATTSYMIITNDKSLTSPLITTLPSTANILRQNRNLSKVFRDNYDTQLLDQITTMIHSLSYDENDIIYYQMLYQIIKQKSPYLGGGGGSGGGGSGGSGGSSNNLTGVNNEDTILIPRTFILTPKLLLLCHEDITCLPVKITLIDSVPLTSISQLKQERDPTKITLVMKSETVLSFTKKKWKLKCDNVNMIMKIRDELRKTCHDANINCNW